MNYEAFFVAVKERIINDLGDNFAPSVLEHLTLSLNYNKRSNVRSNDQYRSKASKIPAYYNPNTHAIHLNISVLDHAQPTVVENVYYHELVHASSHHARMTLEGMKILKSGLKIQMWDEDDNQTTLHRGLNEGLTQYFANTFTNGGPAYRGEVQIIGRLIQKIGLQTLKSAYFGASIDELEEKIRLTLGKDVFHQLSAFVDAKNFEAAEALLA